MNLPLLSGRQVLAALTRLGFVEIDRRGSHVKMEHPDGRRIVFPYHPEADRYTLKARRLPVVRSTITRAIMTWCLPGRRRQPQPVKELPRDDRDIAALRTSLRSRSS